VSHAIPHEEDLIPELVKRLQQPVLADLLVVELEPLDSNLPFGTHATVNELTR
jgi:hypothetical protein